MRALWQMPELQEIWNHIETGETPVTVTGLSPVHRAQLAAAHTAQKLCHRNAVIFAPDIPQSDVDGT